jgi:hypothetical protein
MLKKAQKLGGDPFEDAPEFTVNQAFIFIKPHAVTEGVKRLVKNILRDRSINVVAEGAITAEAIAEGELVDHHYYSIASKVRAACILAQLLALPLGCCAARIHRGGWDVGSARALEVGLRGRQALRLGWGVREPVVLALSPHTHRPSPAIKGG